MINRALVRIFATILLNANNLDKYTDEIDTINKRIAFFQLNGIGKYFSE